MPEPSHGFKVRFSKKADKTMSKMDPQQRTFIIKWIRKNLAGIEDPRSIGKPLVGEERIWRYWAGQYRLLTKIHDHELVIMIVKVGDRKDVYSS